MDYTFQRRRAPVKVKGNEYTGKMDEWRVNFLYFGAKKKIDKRIGEEKQRRANT